MVDRLNDIVEVLRSRVLRGIEAGTLKRGDRLPSGRDLAREFAVDHRVVLAAYRELAAEGLIEMRQRGGVYVAGPRMAGAAAPIPAAWMVDVLTEGLRREVAAPQLHELLRRCTETQRLRAVVVATTSDQIHGLCRELSDDFGLEAEGMNPSDLTGTATPLPLRRADLIVTTGAHEAQVRAVGTELDKAVHVIEVRPDLMASDWALLLRRPVYVIVATAEFGDMIRAFFKGVEGIENLNIIVMGRDDVSAIPPDAPTYITQSVRAHLDGVHIPGRVLPPARTISIKSAREIFTFIVESNIGAMSRLAQ